MNYLRLKTYNYYPDFQNEDLKRKATTIIENIRAKNAPGYEHFGFNDLALNFSHTNIAEITEFCQLIVDKHITDLVIFTNTVELDNFKIIDDFLFKNDLLTQRKINFHFFNSDDNVANWFTYFNQISSVFASQQSAFLYVSLTPFSEAFLNFILLCLNEFQQQVGYFRALNNQFLVAKEEVEQQILNLYTLSEHNHKQKHKLKATDFTHKVDSSRRNHANQHFYAIVPEQNILIVPAILHNHFAFFSKTNLILAMLKGADLGALLEGYLVGTQDFTARDVEQNLAFKLGYIYSEWKKDKTVNLLIGSNRIFTGLLNAFAKQSLVCSFEAKPFFATHTIFPEGVYTYGQYLFDPNAFNCGVVFELIYEKVDFVLSDEINVKDMNFKIKDNKLSEFTNTINHGLTITLSNIVTLPLCRITVTDNSELSLGKLIALLYWTKIYEAYLLNQNPFETTN
ncbi:hypothetical protein [Mycoplasmopsis columbinasalis]|uniref:Glucose-6-phosphate isomerase n=1 Tax=Mycoplasmopsis columbinasalis TaxID=114880 RepID=A0A449B9S1_9BACT|nr:hypothetical protein [Mycoplasmopsis columbinasalis]VEU77917.1 glucose-6-phosphate isomerase [Mycoplasmopsis columbinasalis]